MQVGDLQRGARTNSALIGDLDLFKELKPADKEEILKDIDLYEDNQGEGVHTNVEKHPIARGFPMWKEAGKHSLLLSCEYLGRWRVEAGRNADKFIGVQYSQWTAAERLEYCRANIRVRAKDPEPVVNINILPALFESSLTNKCDLELLLSLRPEDYPEVQEFGPDGKILKEHSEKTKEGIRAFCSFGRKVSVDDWGFAPNDTSFVLSILECVKQVKVDIKLCMALFDVRLTALESPDYVYLNNAADNVEKVKAREDFLKDVPKFTSSLWMDEDMEVCFELSLTQEHVDHWPAVKFIDPSHVSVQGSIWGAKTFTLREVAAASPKKRRGAATSDAAPSSHIEVISDQE
jgi:hypothetical protein